MMVGDARQIDHMLAIAAAGDADVGLARFAGAIDNAAEDREGHGCFDMAKRILQLLHRADDVKALAGAAWAAYDAHAAGAQAQGLQNFITNAHFFFGFGRQADADRIANACPQ